MGGNRDEAVSLGVVLEAERLEIKRIREKRNLAPVPKPPAPLPPVVPGRDERSRAEHEPKWQTRDLKVWVDVISKAHDANHVGLALSGGGIRSATFSLGVLQALAELKLLFRIDYLSTVSGGGYIGGWLTAWIYRLREHGGFWKVQKRLATNRVHQEDDNKPPRWHAADRSHGDRVS